ncbi:MAG: hypothetical protein ACFFAN_05760 [Promethearchaeota archaeon]
MSRIVIKHGGLYSQLVDLDYFLKQVARMLLASETPLIESNRLKFTVQNAIVSRMWQIREVDTGNVSHSKENLLRLEGV